MEFLLDLDVGNRRRRRLELEKQIAGLETEWSQARQHLTSRLGNLSRLQNIPSRPVEDFSSAPSIGVEVYLEEEWLALEDAVDYPSEHVAAIRQYQLEVAFVDLKRDETMMRPLCLPALLLPFSHLRWRSYQTFPHCVGLANGNLHQAGSAFSLSLSPPQCPPWGRTAVARNSGH
ncbi:hypothetical protein ILFOPFJJ_07051 [Ensifer psoraleae]|uniref:hypothetical protein n=1 Tax=Sinorhizobium psoraleae TaxID=520838 RepID=UPI00156A69EF|nr:hypothetical protein [Sinorhizobium psoraleae]NRP76127.1 hypothetical protein [Sinorhizobium psoraleae]